MYQTQDKILPLDKAQRRINAWRVRSEVIVFTNGCFDLLHLGHVDYLEQAAREGERLVVGLNSDASVRRLKGAERPVQDEQSRARILAALEFVDMVVIFEEDTPEALIEALAPDVLVKGAEYAEDQIVGAGFVISRGGKLVRIPMLEGNSSSALIEKLKQL
jgi:rfaE bifunctional protein nucleotidyltransferase chain/domain